MFVVCIMFRVPIAEALQAQKLSASSRSPAVAPVRSSHRGVARDDAEPNRGETQCHSRGELPH